MPSFSDIANKKASDVVKPPLPPHGTYKFLVTKIPDVRDQGQWEVVDFQLTAREAKADVDQATLQSLFPDITKIILRKSFMFDKNDAVEFQKAEYNMKRFMIDHVKAGSDDMSMKQLMNACINCPVMAEVVWKPGKGENEGEFFANIGKTAPVS